MKKISVMAFAAIMAIAMASCNQTRPPKADFKTDIDTLSYSIGNGIATQVKEELANDLDSAYYAEFLRGLNDATNALSDEAKAAYYRGVHVAININLKEMGNIYFYGDKDTTKTFSANNFLAAFNDVFYGKKSQLDEATASQQYMQFNNVMRQNYNAYRIEKEYGENRKAGEKFLEENKKKPGVQTTKSGLQYKVITTGTGAKPASDQMVKVDYEGRLIDGTVFDSSIERGEPVEFPLNAVIPGWTEALTMMPVGSEWEIYVPQELAYGAQPGGNVIKPFSALIFKVKLLDIVEDNVEQ